MSTADTEQWTPVYSKWRHGGWYVNNVRHPSGAVGCVSSNYADGKWRIVCDSRPDAHEKHTYKTRDAAARAEHELAIAAYAALRAAAEAIYPECEHTPVCLLADAARNTRELDDDEPLNDDPKDDPCDVCGDTPTDATSGAGERLCAPHAADDQAHGEDVSWDDDAPQEYELTPVTCGYCGQAVKFSPSGQWTLDGTDSMSDLSQLHCDESPDRRHDPAHEDEGEDTTDWYRCSCGEDVVESEQGAHENGMNVCMGHPVAWWQGAGNAPERPTVKGRCVYCGHTGPAELFEKVNTAGNLACRAMASCELRQAEQVPAYVLGRMLRSVRIEMRSLTTEELANLAVDIDGWQRDVHLTLSGRGDSAAELAKARADREARRARKAELTERP
jgi:hypothetical protein